MISATSGSWLGCLASPDGALPRRIAYFGARRILRRAARERADRTLRTPADDGHRATPCCPDPHPVRRAASSISLGTVRPIPPIEVSRMTCVLRLVILLIC